MNLKFIKKVSGDIVKYDLKNIKSTGYVVDTFEAVIWTFMNTDKYADCILKTINLGGDTDTKSAIARGLQVYSMVSVRLLTMG